MNATALANAPIDPNMDHSDSVAYLAMRQISPPIQTDIRHVGR